MANSLNAELEGKVLVLDPRYLSAEYRVDPKWRLFRADGGFGCHADTIGNAVFGHELADGERDRMEGFMFERFATEADMPRCPECGTDALMMCHDEECPMRWKRCDGEESK